MLVQQVIVLSRYNILISFHRRGAALICVKEIQISKINMIKDNKSNQYSSIYCRMESYAL